MRLRPLRLAHGAVLGVALLAASCAGAPTRIHTLDAQPPTGSATAAYSGMAFRVDTVHIPAAFDRPELIRRTDPYTVTLSDNDRWAAPLGELMRRTLTQDLARRLPAGAVIYPDAPKPPNAGGLVVDILSISPTDGGVTMEVSWTWLAPKIAQTPTPAPQAAVAVARPLMARLTVPSAGPGPGAIAPEISALMGRLADEIASR